MTEQEIEFFAMLDATDPERAKLERHKHEQRQVMIAETRELAARTEAAIAAVDEPEPELEQGRAPNGRFAGKVTAPPSPEALRGAFIPAIDAEPDMAVKIALVEARNARLREQEDAG